MKNFSENDKQIINKILAHNRYGFRLEEILSIIIPQEYYVKIMEDKSAFKIANTKQFRFFADRDLFATKQEALYLSLFQFNELFEYLTSNQYVKTINSKDFEEIEYNETKRTTNLVFIFNDELRFNLFNKFYFVYQSTDMLKELKENKFVTAEDRILKTNTTLARWSCAAAIVAAICAVYTFFVNSNSTQVKTDTVDKRPFNIRDTVIKHDTIIIPASRK